MLASGERAEVLMRIITTGNKGFTVIELLIGAMIVAILGVVAAPQFTGLLQRFRLNGATRVVWGDLHRARLMAIKENASMRVNFPGASYNIVRVKPGQSDEVVFIRNLAADYPGISVSISNDTVTFGSTGSAGGGSQTVQVQSSAGTKSFTVLTTGRIGNAS